MPDGSRPFTVPPPAEAAPPPARRIGPGAELPDPTIRRWGKRHKEAVVRAVRAGLLSAEDACRRYALTFEELLAWERGFEALGVAGLQATRRLPLDLRAAGAAAD